MEEVLLATVGPWGGNSVDDQFMKFLIESLGKWVFEAHERLCGHKEML